MIDSTQALPIFTLLAGNLAVLLLLLSLVWIVSLHINNASIIDIFWGPACALPAWLTFFRVKELSSQSLLLTVLVSLWAGRLALHLAKRNLGHGEDYRYARMRENIGDEEKFALWSLTNIFWLQGLIAWFVSLPVQLGQIEASAAGFMTLAGVACFVVGLTFETVGDWQLMRFKANPANKGKLMTRGLWSYTRHPNYFGDAMVWTGLTLIALESPWGAWTVLSPMVMAFFLVRVSGKAMTERHMAQKYPEYADYKKRVSGFIPLPQKQARP